jgi:peptide deformylase
VIRRIYTYPEAVLKEVAQDVTDIDGVVATAIDDMVETMYAAPGVGLAAPQIGLSQRVIVLDVDHENKGKQLLKLVNPVIAGDTVWTVTQRNTVWRTDLATGTSIRLLAHPTPVTAPVALWDGAVLVSDTKGIVTAYEPDGSSRWRLAVGKPIEVAPMPFEGDLLVLGGRGDLHRFGR